MIPRIASCSLISLLTLSICGATPPLAGESGWKELAPGVSLNSVSRPAEPYEIRLLRVDRKAQNLAVISVPAGANMTVFEPIDRTAARRSAAGHTVVAGVNGDFYHMSKHEYAGLLLGPTVTAGEIVTSGAMRKALYFTQDGAPHLGGLNFQGTITSGEKTITIDALNQPPKRDGVYLFNRFWGRNLPEAAIRVRAQRPVTQGVFPVRRAEAFQQPRAAEELALVAVGEKAAKELAALPEAFTLTLRFRETAAPVAEAVGSWQILLADGKIPFAEGAKEPRHPRTMVGFNADYLYFVTVDGRQPGWSKGMRPTDQARFLQELHCTDGGNLDGGGSTVLWAEGKAQNRPSDGRIRANANAILIFKK